MSRNISERSKYEEYEEYINMSKSYKLVILLVIN